MAAHLIPECPGGGKIKTHNARRCEESLGYQNAPVGARSKQRSSCGTQHRADTRMPRWGQDQNSGLLLYCAGGNDTRMPRWGQDQNPEAATPQGEAGYQNAPVGARSKHLCPPRSDRATIATPNDAPEGAEFIAPNRDDLHAVLGGFPGILGRRRNRIGGREARAIRKRQHCQVCRTTQSSPLCPPVVAPDPPNLKPSPDPVSPREADTSPSFR